MKEEIYACKDCGYEESYPINSEVWCSCHPRIKKKMVNLNEKYKKEMKVERRLNLEVSR